MYFQGVYSGTVVPGVSQEAWLAARSFQRTNNLGLTLPPTALRYPHNPHLRFPHDSLRVCVDIKHRGGYGWGIGSFRLYPDERLRDVDTGKLLGNFHVITPLPVRVERVEGPQGQPEQSTAVPDASSERHVPDLPGLLSIKEWVHECLSSHRQCQNVYGMAEAGSRRAWCPSRLVYLDREKKRFRIVHKDRAADAQIFQQALGVRKPRLDGIRYISLSHCWGPPPDPDAPNGGRSVLNTANVDAWSTELPFDWLAATFQHALLFTAMIGCQLIWIDSLCILQDSKEDWLAESATMGDIYKYALFNIAALSAKSDSDGFLDKRRDTHVEFGFRAPLATLLGRHAGEKRIAADFEGRQLEQECLLLRGSAKLCWAFEKQVTTAASNSPLFTRGWVYQERCLARRTLAFTDQGVFWACDGGSRSEQPEWATQSMERAGLRDYQLLARNPGEHGMDAMWQQFHMRWHSTVTSYTVCNLTRQTDKLIAVGAIARELASTEVGAGKYLAGLWETALIEQLDWLCVTGSQTPARKLVGDAEYVAPSWSWASITSPVQPRMPSNPYLEPGPRVVLVEVVAAGVQTLTEYAFGAVRSGWIRLRGRLNRIDRVVRSTHRYSDGTTLPLLSLIDSATGSSLWFSSDTLEGHGLKAKGAGTLAWLPLKVRFQRGSIECSCLVLQEVEGGVRHTGYVQHSGERVKLYRRLGTGNFGRVVSRLAEDKLVSGLGTFEVGNGSDAQLAAGFRARDDGYEEFVLI